MGAVPHIRDFPGLPEKQTCSHWLADTAYMDSYCVATYIAKPVNWNTNFAPSYTVHGRFLQT